MKRGHVSSEIRGTDSKTFREGGGAFIKEVLFHIPNADLYRMATSWFSTAKKSSETTFFVQPVLPK